MGTIKGSAAASVVTTGGMIMPLIMGAAAFLIASFLEIPCIQVLRAVLLPAILYSLGIFLIVKWESAR